MSLSRREEGYVFMACHLTFLYNCILSGYADKVCKPLEEFCSWNPGLNVMSTGITMFMVYNRRMYSLWKWMSFKATLSTLEELIMRRRNPQTRRFTDWLEHEVTPTQWWSTLQSLIMIFKSYFMEISMRSFASTLYMRITSSFLCK